MDSAARRTREHRAILKTPSTSLFYRFSVQQYHRMIERGELSEADPVELLEGKLVEKMSRNPPHDGSIVAFVLQLSRVLPDGYHLRPQCAYLTAIVTVLEVAALIEITTGTASPMGAEAGVCTLI